MVTETKHRTQKTKGRNDIMASIFENAGLYSLKEMHHAGLAPTRMMANAAKHMFNNPLNPLSYTGVGRQMAAAGELVERITQNYPKPEFGLTYTNIDGKHVDVWEEVIVDKAFCKLLHFKRSGKRSDEKLLIVAPMSGHYATLLRGTVEAMLPEHDVYITDWVDARLVPMSKGKFDLEDNISYIMEFIRSLGPDVHVMAVCQPAVPVLCAISLLAQLKDPAQPRSMTLMGGPIDTRKATTSVNTLATQRPHSWFANTVIATVPYSYPGAGRKVYPGFLQLAGFMSMNLGNHMMSHWEMFKHLVQGDDESADATKDFYDEYRSVCDMTAEFYLQTIDVVFQRHALPDGEYLHRGLKVDPKAITKVALLAIEGERDDICAVGQTAAAHDLCRNLRPHLKKHHLQAGAGHYGVFSGKKWQTQIYPTVRSVILSVE